MSTALEARTLHVDELVHNILTGRIRIPRFQRRLRWTGEDVRLLFDSVHRGFPVGTLLFWERPGEPGRHRIGPLEIELPRDDRAWWVVDGQQRLTSLTGVLHHPDPTDPADPYAVWFDPLSGRFVAPHHRGPHPTWIPLARLGDPVKYMQWLHAWESGVRQPELVERAMQLATSLRNYRVPAYLVREEDEQVVREIFHRVNDAGRRLRYHEVFDALLGAQGAEAPSAEDLSEILDRDTGFGRLHPDLVAACTLALEGRDPTRPPPWSEVGRAPESYRQALRNLRPVLASAVRFVVEELQVPHVRLLPYPRTPLIILAVYFDRFREPAPNACRILRRWFWRGTLALRFPSGDRYLLRGGLAAARQPGRDDEVALALLASVPGRPSWSLPERFDARSASNRIALVAMARAMPRDPDGGQPFDIESAMADARGSPWSPLLPPRSCSHRLARTAANRFLPPPDLSERHARGALRRLARRQPDHPVLASHLVDPRAARAWAEGDFATLLERRADALRDAVDRLGRALAEWNHPSRPTIAHLLDAPPEAA